MSEQVPGEITQPQAEQAPSRLETLRNELREARNTASILWGTTVIALGVDALALVKKDTWIAGCLTLLDGYATYVAIQPTLETINLGSEVAALSAVEASQVQPAEANKVQQPAQ